PQDWRYYGGMLGNKNMGANVKYASDPFWAEKAAAHIYTVDRGINSGSSKEWNYYSIGIFKTANSVKNSTNQQVYPITAPDANGALALYSSYTETPIILKDTDASDGKYLVWPARNNILSSSNNIPTALPYNWNGNEYVSSSGVSVVNVGKQIKGISTEFKTAKVNGNVLELVSHVSYTNGEIAPENVISGKLVAKDGLETYNLAVSKVNQYDYKFTIDATKLSKGKEYRFVATADLGSEQVWNGNKPLPLTMKVDGAEIIPKLEGSRINFVVEPIKEGISTEFKS
ncbi:MAG TPA: hypothetical protein DCY20_02845, partial [Firmicutes bacterium]|nr:hypothetical protein [Bacillota bacterium]